MSSTHRNGIGGARLAFSLVCVLIVSTSSAADLPPADRHEAVQPENASVQLRTSGFRTDLVTGELVQLVTIENVTDRPLRGRVRLSLKGLGESITQKAAAVKGRAINRGPSEIDLEPESPDGLLAGEQLVVLVRFDKHPRSTLKYEYQVLQDAR